MSGPSIIRGRLVRYRQTVGWIATSALRDHWRPILGILVLNGAGIGTAAVSMGLVLRYLHWAQRGQSNPLTLLGVVVAERPSAGSLLLVTGGFLFLGVFSATTLYLAERKLTRVVADFQERLMQHLILVMTERDLGRLMLRFERRLGEAPSPLDLMLSGARFTAFALRSMVQLFLPALTMLVSVCTLVWIDPLATLALSILSIFYVWPLVGINHDAARHHRDYRRQAKLVPRTIRTAVSAVFGSSGPVRDEVRTRGIDLLAPSGFNEMEHDRYNRLLVVKRVVLLNSIFLVLTVTVIVGLFARSSEISWPHLLGFLLAVQFTWASVRQFTGLFTKLNQYFAELERVTQFIHFAKDRERSEHREGGRRSLEAVPVALERGTGPKSVALAAVEPVTLDRGMHLVIVDPRRCDRLSLERVVALLAERADERRWPGGAAAVHDQAGLVPELTIRQHAFGGAAPSADADRALQALLADLEIADKVSKLPRGLDTPTAELGLEFSRRDRSMIAAAYLFVHPPPVVIMNAALLRGWTLSQRRAALQRCTRSLLIQVDRDTSLFDESERPVVPATHVAILFEQDELVIGTIEWYRSHRASIDMAIAALRASLGEEADSGDDADDMNELE